MRAVNYLTEMTSDPSSYAYGQVIRGPKVEQVRAAVVPKNFVFGKNNPKALSGEIEVKAPPVNLAYEVIAQIEGREHVISTLTCAPGKSSTYHLTHSDKKLGAVPASITLVMSGSRLLLSGVGTQMRIAVTLRI